METLFQDIRFGIRMLAKGRGVTILALLALAFGIGANTAIFSVVNTVLLRPLPYKDSEHLLRLSIVFQQLGPEGSTLSPSDFLDFRAQKTTCSTSPTARRPNKSQARSLQPIFFRRWLSLHYSAVDSCLTKISRARSESQF